MTNPSRPASNGRAAVPGSSLWPADSARMMSKAPNASGAQRDLAATGDRRIDPTLAQVPERLADRDRTRRARVGGRQDRPADVEGDAEVGRRRPAEHGQRQVWRDGLDPALEVALVLLLRVGDATERRAEIDPDPPRVGGAPRARRQAGVVEREAAGHQPELAEPVELPGRLGRHPGERVEVVDLGRHLAAERARVEAIDPLDRRPGGAQPGPERVETGPARGDDPEPGDPDAPPVGHAGGPIGVGDPAGLERLGQRLERAERPARDRSREGAVDERGEEREPRPEVVLDRHPASGRRRPARSAT